MVAALIIVGLAYFGSSILVAYECRRAPLVELDTPAAPAKACRRSSARCDCVRCHRRHARGRRLARARAARFRRTSSRRIGAPSLKPSR